MDPKILDEIDCESFFDHVDELIDFPLENECVGGLGAGEFTDFPSIWDDPVFPCYNGNGELGPDLSTELAVPHEDILQLEWLSMFMEDSFADGGMTITKDYNSINKEPSHNQFKISSPISVLESSSSSSTSSCSGEKTLPLSGSYRGTHRSRSKRPRPTSFIPRTQPFVVPEISSEFESISESYPTNKTKNPDSTEQKKKKKHKSTFNSSALAQAVRKCMHCEITKTPQWRAGPMGPKTLCNACGVRYKSGRLLPEYRPAASPTFVASVHSNSHKRVLEMRSKPFDKGCTPLSVVSPPTTSHPHLE